MHPNFHCSIVYNTQDMEVMQTPSTEEWVKKMWYIIHNEILEIKRNKTVPFVKMWMNLMAVIMSEVRQKKKNKYCIISCMKSREKIQMDLVVKQNRDIYINNN